VEGLSGSEREIADPEDLLSVSFARTNELRSTPSGSEANVTQAQRHPETESNLKLSDLQPTVRAIP
jgi:hypothetical protein